MFFSGTQYLPSSSTTPLSDATKDGHITSDSSDDDIPGPSLDPNFQSLKKKLKSKWVDPMTDIAYIHVCSLAADVLPNLANVDAMLLH